MSEKKPKVNKEIDGVDRAKIKVYYETYEDKDKVYQNFRLVASSDKYLRYFTDDRFRGYYTLSDRIEEYFVGDGENILFNEKVYHKNLISIKYDKQSDIEIDESLKSGQFKVSTKIPMTTGCYDCTYFRKKNRKCLYHSKIGIEIKQNCKDFRQK